MQHVRLAKTNKQNTRTVPMTPGPESVPSTTITTKANRRNVRFVQEEGSRDVKKPLSERFSPSPYKREKGKKTSLGTALPADSPLYDHDKQKRSIAFFFFFFFFFFCIK
jgi:hypothetical protein